MQQRSAQTREIESDLHPAPERLLLDAEVEARTGLTRKQRLKMEARGEFPGRVAISPRVTGWVEREIDGWIAERIARRAAEVSARPTPQLLAKQNRAAGKNRTQKK